MKKLIASISFIVLVLGLSAYSFSATNITQTDKGKITAEASESKYVSPDTAKVSFTVKTTDKNSQKAVELNNQKMSTLVDAIKKNLGTNDTIKTTNYSLKPNYEYNNSSKKSVQTGYTVTNSVIVTLRDTKKTSKIINIATLNDATSVSGLSFSVRSTDAVCQELTSKATLKAKKQAESILAPLGKTIDSVDNISYSCNSQSNYQYRDFAMMKTSGVNSTATETPIETGEEKVTAHVTIVFRIK